MSRAVLLVISVLRGIRARDLDYRAMSLVYTSLLALVPLLAVSFSVLKAFGVHTQLEPLLLQILEPLGDNAREVTRAIISSVQQLQVGVLGFVGFLFLFYATVSMLGKIEESFNHIWRTRISRNFIRRLGDYLSFMLGGPLIIFLAFGGMTGLIGSRPGSQHGLPAFIWPVLGSILPYVFIIAVFTFLYRFIPNTRVSLAAALFGGVIAGLLWKFAGWCFAQFVADSTQYHAVYSSFTLPVLFMVWLYLSWLIVLLGVEFSFYFQNPQCLGLGNRPDRLSHRRLETCAVNIMYRVAGRFHRSGGPTRFEDLARANPLSIAGLREVLDALEESGLLVSVGDEREAYLPARDIAMIRLSDIVEALRSGPARLSAYGDPVPVVARVERVMADAEIAMQRNLGTLSLSDLVLESGDSPNPAGEPVS